MQDMISTDDCVGTLRIAVGNVAASHMPSGSLTVMVVLLTAVTAVNGPVTAGPIKSPTKTVPTAVEEVVIAPVVLLKAVALIDSADGMAPTHCATLLTNALAD
jgi:hypothetical protein